MAPVPLSLAAESTAARLEACYGDGGKRPNTSDTCSTRTPLAGLWDLRPSSQDSERVAGKTTEWAGLPSSRPNTSGTDGGRATLCTARTPCTLQFRQILSAASPDATPSLMFPAGWFPPVRRAREEACETNESEFDLNAKFFDSLSCDEPLPLVATPAISSTAPAGGWTSTDPLQLADPSDIKVKDNSPAMLVPLDLPMRKWLRRKIKQVDASYHGGSGRAKTGHGMNYMASTTTLTSSHVTSTGTLATQEDLIEDAKVRQWLPPNSILRGEFRSGPLSNLEADQDERLSETEARYYLDQSQRQFQRHRAAAQRDAKRRQELALQLRLEEEAREARKAKQAEELPRRTHRKSQIASRMADAQSMYAGVQGHGNGSIVTIGDPDSDSSSSGVEDGNPDELSMTHRFSSQSMPRSPRTSRGRRSGSMTGVAGGNQLKVVRKPLRGSAALRLQKLNQNRRSRNNEKDMRERLLSKVDQQLTHARRKSVKATGPLVASSEKVPYKFIGGKPLTAIEAVTARAKKVFFASLAPSAPSVDGDMCKILGDDLPDALMDLGLMPRSQSERRAVNSFLEGLTSPEQPFGFKEFLEVSQQARERVMDIQQPFLEKHFMSMHGGSRSSVAISFESSQVMGVLRAFGCTLFDDNSPVVEEIRNVFNTCPPADEGDEFDQFHALVQHAQERFAEVTFTEQLKIMTDTGLSRFLARDFRRELPELYTHYRNRQVEIVQACGLRNCKIDLRGALNILGDFGILPITENRERDVTKVIFEAKAGSPNARTTHRAPQSTHIAGGGPAVDEALLFDFSELLLTVKRLRKINTTHRQNELQRIFEKYADKYVRSRVKRLDVRGACSVLAEVGLTPRNREQQEIIAELFRDLDTRGTGFICFTELTQLIGRIYEWQERRSRGQFKAYAAAIGLDAEYFQDYVSAFQELDSSDCNALGQRTIKRLLTNVGKKLTSEEFSDLYEKLDNNFSNILELPEFLRLLSFLERDREQEKLKQNKGKKEHEVTKWDLLPQSYEDFMASKQTQNEVPSQLVNLH